MMSCRVGSLLGVLGLLVLGLCGCGGSRVIVVGIEVGDRAPDFSLPDTDDQTLRLSDWRGQPVLLVFYRTSE